MSVDRSTDRNRNREELAQERTRLARERTILAHIRTGFAAFIFGTAILSLFKGGVLSEVLGWSFIVLGAAFVVTGWRSYVLSNRRTRHLLQEVEESVLR